MTTALDEDVKAVTSTTRAHIVWFPGFVASDHTLWLDSSSGQSYANIQALISYMPF